LNFGSNYGCPSKAVIRGEYTKTKVDRYVFLTREIQHQLKIWLDFKYRRGRICYVDKETEKSISEYRTGEKKLQDFIFSINQTDNTRLELLYFNLAHTFSNTLDRIGMGNKEDENKRRRKITLHSFRRFVKTTISDLGYSDYSEWFIGHTGSTYWRKKDNEKAEIFQKIEPYLTFLNIQQLKKQGADLETKIEELKDINQVLREKDKMKEDVIANLSDKLIMLSERLDAIEK
jgi:hypothetical protein